MSTQGNEQIVIVVCDGGGYHPRCVPAGASVKYQQTRAEFFAFQIQHPMKGSYCAGCDEWIIPFDDEGWEAVRKARAGKPQRSALDAN